MKRVRHALVRRLVRPLVVTLTMLAIVQLASCSHARVPTHTIEVVREESSSPLVALHFAFRSGSVDDPVGHEGLTALTASTMLEGGGAGFSAQELRRALFPLAATIDVSADREWTSFVARVPEDRIDRMLELLAAVLVDPALPEATFARLRERAESDLVLGLLGTDEEALAGEALRLAIFGEHHPYAHPVLGRESALASIRLSDVEAHRRRVFCRERLTVGVSGHVPADAFERIDAFIARMPSGACAASPVIPAAPESPRGALLLDAPDAESVSMRLAIPHDVTRAHPDYVALTVAAAYLGLHGQFLGTLMQDVREARGLNYGDYVYAEPRVSNGELRGPAPHHLVTRPLFDVWLRPVPRDSAHFVVRLAARSVDRLFAEGLTDAELARVRDFLLRTMPLALEVDEARLGFAMDARAFGVATPWAEQMRAGLATLTAAELHAAIRRHLDPAKLQIVLVASDASDLARRMANDVPSPITYDHAVGDSVKREDEVIARYPLRLEAANVHVVGASTLFR